MNTKGNIEFQWSQLKVGYMVSINPIRMGAALHSAITLAIPHVRKPKNYVNSQTSSG